VWEDTRKEGVLSLPRTSGNDVVHCLETFVPKADVRTQWSHSTVSW
jgi:hypothetical protein